MKTIYDIADQVGCSTSTVSRVINNRPGVNKLTSEKIKKALMDMQFKPRWKAAPAKAIGVVIYPHRDCLAYPFNAHLFSAISESLFAEGYTVQLIPRSQSDGPLDDIGILASTHQIQGVIIMPMHQIYGFSSRLDHDTVQIPHIVVGAEQSSSLKYHVGPDDYEAGKQSARYLWQLGHRCFGVVTASLSDHGHRNRLNGFKDAIEEFGGHPENIIMRECEHTDIEIGESVAAELLLMSERPTAILLTNSTLAMGFSRGCRKLGIKVPNDISLMGFEDAEELSAIDPPMTVMRQPTRQLGELTVRLLLSQLHGTTKDKDFVKLTSMSLIVRESTGLRRKLDN